MREATLQVTSLKPALGAPVTPAIQVGAYLMKTKRDPKEHPFILKLQTSEDKTTLMAWVSTSDQQPLTNDQALTGAANLFVEVCSMMGVDPYTVLDKFWESASEHHAEDFEES